MKRACCLGRGRFTEVYVGDWKSGKIVEKVFSTTDEERWFREKKVYETALLRHDNILGIGIFLNYCNELVCIPLIRQYILVIFMHRRLHFSGYIGHRLKSYLHRLPFKWLSAQLPQ